MLYENFLQLIDRVLEGYFCITLSFDNSKALQRRTLKIDLGVRKK